MEIFPDVLAKMLLVSFLFGGQLGMIFDIGRVLRLLFIGAPISSKLKGLYASRLPFSKRAMTARDDRKSRKILLNITVFLTDFLFSAYAVIGLVVINYAYNDGKFRIFTLIGAALTHKVLLILN